MVSFLIFLSCLCKCTENFFDSQRYRQMIIRTLQPVLERSNTLNSEIAGGHSVMMSWLFTLYKCQQHSSFKSSTALNIYFLPLVHSFNIYFTVSRDWCLFSVQSGSCISIHVIHWIIIWFPVSSHFRYIKGENILGLK